MNEAMTAEQTINVKDTELLQAKSSKILTERLKCICGCVFMRDVRCNNNNVYADSNAPSETRRSCSFTITLSQSADIKSEKETNGFRICFSINFIHLFWCGVLVHVSKPFLLACISFQLSRGTKINICKKVGIQFCARTFLDGKNEIQQETSKKTKMRTGGVKQTRWESGSTEARCHCIVNSQRNAHKKTWGDTQNT